MRGRIVLAGSLAQKPGQGGHPWIFLQYLHGFRRLGWDVLFLDRLEPDMCIDGDGRPSPPETSTALAYFLDTMRWAGLEGSFALCYRRGERYFGLPRQEVVRRVKGSALLLNVMGFFNDEEVLAAAPLRVFLDVDPGFPQMWRELGLHDAFRGHEAFVTLGRNIGRPDCAIPTCGLPWITTLPPVLVEQWPAQPPPADAPFTGIGVWRGPYAPVEFQGRTYGLRVHQLRKVVPLPRLCPATRFEMALDIHPADAKDLRALQENGWRLVDPRAVVPDPERYRSYIVGSQAELLVPKQIYVDTRCGLLSDRSLFYLASGRPVLACDTGLGDLYPTGAGLLLFRTLEEAVTGVEAIRRDYPHHVKAARDLALEYFDSDRVLPRLLGALGVG